MKQKGLSSILIVILVTALAVGGYLIYTQLPKPASPPQNSLATSQTPQPTLSSSSESTNSAETTNWKTYINTKYGYSVKYPTGNIQENFKMNNILGNPVSQVIFNIDPNPKGRSYWIIVYPSFNTVSVEDWAKKHGPQVDHEFKDIEIDNTKGKVVSPPLAGGIYEKQGAYFLKGTYMYSIIVSSPRTDDKILEEFNQILSTFKFTP